VADALRFPQPPGRGSGGPVAGFPQVTDTAPRQGGRGFVYASWWCSDLATRLTMPCPDGATWRQTHVEMALFMIGKPPKGDAMPTAPVARAGGAVLAGKAAKAMANNEPLQDAAREQFLNQIQKRQAKQRAARFAFQTGSELAQVQYADGIQRWTIFKDKTPIASFPGFNGDLSLALVHHDLDRLNLRDPEAVQAEAEEEKETKKIKVPDWMPWFGGDAREEPPEVRYLPRQAMTTE